MHYLFILQELEIDELCIPKLMTAYFAQVEINNLLLPTQETALFCTSGGEWIAKKLLYVRLLKYALRYFTVLCSTSEILLSVANTFAIEFAKNFNNFWFFTENFSKQVSSEVFNIKTFYNQTGDFRSERSVPQKMHVHCKHLKLTESSSFIADSLVALIVNYFSKLSFFLLKTSWLIFKQKLD